MESIGIDVHKGESQICITTPTGEVHERRVATRRERFADVWRCGRERVCSSGSRPRASGWHGG